MADLYTLNLDKDSFVLSIAHTDRDSVELDLNSIDTKYLNAYQYLAGQLILNEARKAEIIEEEEIRENTPTPQERIESQVFYTAMMTDTLLEEDI